ncbi:MAG: MBL fold metallo-hydrolase [Clostridia bacterium]|nr:MBL fold metallo-hydrolase [Clostridia bacterium]
MKPIRILSLYSGSTGNSFLIQGPEGAILIDAGKSAKRLCASLCQAGISPDEISAIFVTHEHQDHISALPVFLKHHPIPVHLPAPSACRLENEPWSERLLLPHPPIFTTEAAGMKVTSFPTPHDSRASVGYRIEINRDGRSPLSVGLATDIGYVTDTIHAALLGCHAVILESNHDVEMLRYGPYPYDLKQRILSRRGHLSNEDSAIESARLAQGGTRAFLLAHLSLENNRPDVALDAHISSLGSEDVRLCVAHAEELTELVLEEEL